MCKPILKWAGGKRQLLNKLTELMPKKYNRYFEPFVGGGALFFEIQPENALINDCNEELINLYETVRDHCQELINDVVQHKNEKDYYYKIRSLDRDPVVWTSLSKIQRASRLVYLNRTGYNGLYRVNSKGENNVPYGRYKNPTYLDIQNLWECSKLLQKTQITCDDFTSIIGKVKKGDFVYFDPPYAPVSKTANFTSYSKNNFDLVMQSTLQKLCIEVEKNGAYFMLSNSHTPFILDLYHQYNIHTVYAKRNINSNANLRGKIQEVIITNY